MKICPIEAWIGHICHFKGAKQAEKYEHLKPYWKGPLCHLFTYLCIQNSNSNTRCLVWILVKRIKINAHVGHGLTHIHPLHHFLLHICQHDWKQLRQHLLNLFIRWKILSRYFNDSQLLKSFLQEKLGYKRFTKFILGAFIWAYFDVWQSHESNMRLKGLCVD